MKVELNKDFDSWDDGVLAGGCLLVTPSIGEDYWIMRVRISPTQSIVAFPKFTIIGIGFAKEKADWNTNLPWGCEAEKIFNHIKCNKGVRVSDDKCIEAIKLLQKEIKERFGENLEKLRE